MAKFCEHCGNPLDEGAAFCDNCGARTSAAPGQRPVQQPMQQPVQRPIQQPVQQPVQRPMQQPGQPYGQYPGAYAAPAAPPQKKKKGWLIALIACGCAALLAVLIVFVIVPLVKPAEEAPSVVIEEKPAASKPTLQKPAKEEPEPPEETVEPEVEIPDFEAYGIRTDIQIGVPFDVSADFKDKNNIFLGKGTLLSFTREGVTEEMVAFMRENDADVAGYEVLRVSFTVEYPSSLVDDEEKKFKGNFYRVTHDYNHIDHFNNTITTRTDTAGEYCYSNEILIDGEATPIYYWADISGNIDGDVVTFYDDRTYLVPAGYDGIVCGYRDARLPKDNCIYDDYHDSDYILFRLIGGDAPAAQPEPIEGSAPTDTSSLGLPSELDFTWIADAQSGSLTGDLLGKDSFIGAWKAEIVFDGVFELMTLTIAKDGTVTLAPYQVNFGSGWVDESDDGPYTMSGKFDQGGAGNIVATGDYGNLELYQFLSSYGTQYGIGTLLVPSGETAKVYLVRP